MALTLHPNSGASILVELQEWDQRRPNNDCRLRGRSFAGNPAARQFAETLRRRVEIREGYEGIEITSSSFVGRVDIGSLRIAIRPKLPMMPLACLLRYAYGLRDLSTVEETLAPSTRNGLHDLLISLLADEIEELLHRGLSRRYVPLSETLANPKGRILVESLARRGGVREAQLPCRHFERRVDWHLNQVLRAGLDTASRMTQDRDLRRRVHQIADMFGDVKHLARLDTAAIDCAERGLTRLTLTSAPALTIIRLLHDMLGVAFNKESEPSRMPGFLFDMNTFFQRLLSRFLHENLVAQRVVDERGIRNVFAYAGPKPRTAPIPRPDYALYEGRKLRGFLDAKYRDAWERWIPAEWLYQLSIYALASPDQVSVLLYASTEADACDERIEVRPPVWLPGRGPACVILRPVVLTHLAELVGPKQGRQMAIRRRQLAEKLTSFEATTTSPPAGHRHVCEG
jgi:5-methylcytosine-specific restriction enzyme subunit McrC